MAWFYHGVSALEARCREWAAAELVGDIAAPTSRRSGRLMLLFACSSSDRLQMRNQTSLRRAARSRLVPQRRLDPRPSILTQGAQVRQDLSCRLANQSLRGAGGEIFRFGFGSVFVRPLLFEDFPSDLGDAAGDDGDGVVGFLATGLLPLELVRRSSRCNRWQPTRLR